MPDTLLSELQVLANAVLTIAIRNKWHPFPSIIHIETVAQLFKIIKFLEENVGGKLLDIGLWNDFWI